MKNLIGIYSPRPQSGKSTVYKFLNEIAGYERFPFASPLKELATHIFQTTGVPESEARRLVYEDKEEQLPGFPSGITARVFLQQLGTNFGRDVIDPTIWVRIWSNTLKDLPESIQNVVVDDVRFENEVDAIRALGGVIWKIERPEPPSGFLMSLFRRFRSFLKRSERNHHSEGNLNHIKFDEIIVNNGSLEDLRFKVNTLCHIYNLI